MSRLVWYACYGSNLNERRFLLYLKGGDASFFGVTITQNGANDPKDPVSIKPYTFNHPICFMKHSKNWGGGVAFLDTRKSGLAYGKAYLITEEQFQAVMEQEGPWYPLSIDLGMLDGYPVKTFTGICFNTTKPSQAYLNTIKEGLRDLGLKEEAIDAYLNPHGSME